MICKDALVTFLKQYGYNLMSFPKEDIRPLDLFTKNGGALEKIGKMEHIFKAGMEELPMPTLIENLHTANISKMKSDSVNTKLGVSLLSNILTGMGMKDLGITTQFGKARNLMFQFNDVFEDKIELIELDCFLSAAQILNIGNNTKKLMAKNELYVITSVLKSNSISINTGESKTIDISAEASDCLDIISGNIGLSFSAENKSEVTFSGKKQLVFGFRAIRLFFENGFYSAYDITSDVVGRNIDDLEEEPRSEYTLEEAFIEL
jgi:hypothetical protein